MTKSTQEMGYVGLLLAGSLLGQYFIGLLPAIVLFPVIVARTVESPLVYLTTVAIIGELFATTPPGIMTLVVFVPWLVSRILPSITTDLSFVYLGLIAAMVLVQFGVLFAPDVVHFSRAHEIDGFAVPLGVMPWTILAPAIVFSSLIIFTTTILVHFNTKW